MEKEKRVLEIENDGIFMKEHEQNLYILNNKILLLYDMYNQTVINSKEVLHKNGKSRAFIIDGNSIYMKDFCMLYEYDKNTFTLRRKWKLGTDLSSDINALGSDNDNIYASIRNGTLAVINKISGDVSYYKVSNYSMWDIVVTPYYLYAGNVNGNFLIIDKNNFTVSKCIPLHKKNLKSLLLLKDTFFTASQDLSMKALDINSFEVKLTAKKCHKKMFVIVGSYQNHIVTTSPPCRETKIWNMNDLSLCETLPFASWNMIIIGNFLFFNDKKGICVF
ncbi:hypothetical protein ACFIJ5_18665 (plasmid) [Haloimpatiens sp. FM7330]|uniref:hypothetical protein n=1 Tax=Haloimpatiens sp. FM7330 TaxID=3298610 RepID=UPI0036331AE9